MLVATLALLLGALRSPNPDPDPNPNPNPNPNSDHGPNPNPDPDPNPNPTLPLLLILTLTLTLIRRAARRPRPLLRMGGTTAVRYAACRRTRARLTAPRVVRAPTGARRRRRRRRWRQGQAHEAPGRRSSVGGRLRAAAGVTEKRDSVGLWNPSIVLLRHRWFLVFPR